MDQDQTGISGDVARGLSDLAELRQFPGAARDFWPRFLACAGRLTEAQSVVLLLANPEQEPVWRTIGEWPPRENPARNRATFAAPLEAIAERCAAEGALLIPGGQGNTLAVRLKLHQQEEAVVLAAVVGPGSAGGAREALVRLSMAADTPELYQQNLASRQARSDVEKFATVLDLMTPVNEQTHFLAAALALCNGVASNLHCERVSLGWLERGYVKLQAISRTEKFERQMAAAQALEVAMEECLDQDEEIVWPRPEGSSAITRDHESFAGERQSGNVCSVPLRVDDRAAGVLTCERQESSFSPLEIQQLRLYCDQVGRRLADLKHYDRWFGARWTAAAREQLSKFLGPEHTWAKLGAIAGVLVLAILFFVKAPYRVEGNFIVRSDEVAYMTAPFDGYIEEVSARAGDHVPSGGKLLSLDRSELLLDESAALADVERYQREAEKSRAANELAEMQIGEALKAQATSRLDLARYRLAHAVIKSPFDSVVVEGDLRDRIGAPVKQGDAMFKVARTDTLYAEGEIDERDVNEILDSRKGEIAFVTRPRLKFPVTIEAVEPSAVPRKDSNVFLVRLRFEQKPESWWRPGMTGVCKIEVEKRSLFWILTHRTVDFLRMKLWW